MLAPRSSSALRLGMVTLALGLAVGLTGCAVGITQPGGGGAGGSDGAGGAGGASGTGTGGGATTTSTSTGPMGPCVMAVDCDFLDDACNQGTCINGACVKQPSNDGTSCDDGLFCTEGDVCSSGQCVGGSQKFCPSVDNCHIGSCVEATKSCGSVAGNDGAQCDDLDPCTGLGICFGGLCSKGTPVDCTIFDSACSDGVCDPVTGCKPLPKKDGSPCNDSLFCTINDQCQGGTCKGTPNTCVAPGDTCQMATCSEATQSCISIPGNDGGKCDDGSTCTTGETCSAGKCVGGVPANAGGKCDDGDACTMNDTCSAGVCAGSPVACMNGDGCCPQGCTELNDIDCACAGWKHNGGCWYTADAVGMSCDQVCAAHGGFDAAHTQHVGNEIGLHFWPQKANGSTWVSIECSSTDNNTNWGADGSAPDPAFTHAACHVNCACMK